MSKEEHERRMIIVIGWILVVAVGLMIFTMLAFVILLVIEKLISLNLMEVNTLTAYAMLRVRDLFG
jgi:hypothetical protein